MQMKSLASSSPRSSSCAALILVGMLALFTGANQAAAAPPTTTTWSGLGGSGNWSDASNWSTLPTTSNNWGLVFGGTTQTTGTNNIGTINTIAMSFTNNGSAGQTSTFTLSGSTLALSSAAITTTATSGGALASSGDVIANALSLTAANTVTLGAGHNLSLTTGGIIGSGSITYGVSGGSATVYLSGINNYSGGTTITGGQVRTAADGAADGFSSSAFGTGSVIVSGSGSVVLRNATTLANNFTIGGNGLSGSGTQGAIRGSFSTSNRTATISGSVALSADATITTAASTGVTEVSLAINGPIDLGSRVLTLSPDLAVTNTTSTNIVLNGGIGGSGSVVVVGQSQSRVLLGGASNYTGGTTLQSGTLAVGNGSALGTGSLGVNGGVLDLNGQSLSVGVLNGMNGGVITSSVAGPAAIGVNQSSSGEFAGSIQDGAGVVSLAKSGTSILYISGNNTYSGTTTVTAGQIRTAVNGAADGSNNDAFGTSSVIVSGSGSVALRNATTLANNFTIGGSGLYGSGTEGAIRGSFSTSNRTASISGTVALSADATITTAAVTSVTGAKLLLSGPINLGAHTLTFAPAMAGSSTTSNVSIVVTGTMSGTGGMVVNGASAVYLNGRNDSTGATTVQAGVLGGNGVIAGIVTVESGAWLTPGSAENTTGSLAVGGLQLNSGATAAMDISGTAVGLYDQVVAVNAVNFGGALAIDFTQNGFANFDSWQLFSGASFTGGFASVTASGSYGDLTFINVGSGEWKATDGLLGAGQSLSFYEDNSHAIGSRYAAGQLVLVPEPSTIALAGVGLLIAGWRNWRQRRAARGLSMAGSAAI